MAEPDEARNRMSDIDVRRHETKLVTWLVILVFGVPLVLVLLNALF